MAPTVAMATERKSNRPAVTVPHPKNRVPSQPPMKAPTIPSRMVIMHPEGSRPGIRYLANDPATRPRRIQYSQSGKPLTRVKRALLYYGTRGAARPFVAIR
jgi:hypothetical protein